MEREPVPFSLKAPGPWETPGRAVGPWYPYREECWGRVHVGVPEGWEGEGWPHGTQTTSILAAGPVPGVSSRIRRREKERRGWWARGQAPFGRCCGVLLLVPSGVAPTLHSTGESSPFGQGLGLISHVA